MTGLRVSASWLAHQLGGDGQPNSAGWCRCSCPAHQSGSLALALRDGAHGLCVKCFGGCARPAILNAITAFLAHGQLRHGSPPANGTSPLQEDERTAIHLASAQRLWDGSSEIAGTLAEQYLRGRGISIALPATLRFHPSVWRADCRPGAPAMLAAITDVHDDQQAIQRTWIPPLSPRLKLSLGPTTGGAVRLAEAADTVAIVEGVESGLALMQLTGWPTWAALSTSGMRGIVLPERIRDVLIGADHDANGAGLAAANALRARLLADGRTVRVSMPNISGWDFNDVLQHGERHSD
jgi:hypothetical protein